jgi:hypothetical protein
MNASTAATTSSLERARQAMAKRHPGAEIVVRSWRGRPVVVAREGNLIRLVRHKYRAPEPAVTRPSAIMKWEGEPP